MTEEEKETTSLFHVLVRNPMLKLFIFIVGAIAAFFIEMGANKLIVNYFPNYFEDESKQILESQNKHFEDLHSSLSELKKDFSSSNNKEIVKNIENSLKAVKSENEDLVLTLNSLEKENSKMREKLKEIVGANIGKDFKIKRNGSARFELGTVSNRDYGIWNGGNIFTVTTVETRATSKLVPGNKINANLYKDKMCSVTYMGYDENNKHDFSIHCKLIEKKEVSS